ncbi:YsnF/AvaK domain-containing protein [Gordonia sp. HY002]|uniref:YsnF/AvaK domain-containing protein n=1 Tax=Gordonia zhenghanii TaxID=2911516 RepID=UPI001EEFE8B3|nr:YsnF/AvaK domain-containing protein [Gordonia zhenghanii]MCF8572327.1 YsnF/AvaK domain-containing protein [Gordonia zhenghanii]MCF8607313.1 YsnF/AvaK domain-containing protein [Gordonia zhenghanii]
MSITQTDLEKLIGAPKWAAVNTGLFGLSSSLVPLAGAAVSGDDLVVAPTKATVKDAPHLDADDGISAKQEDELYAHYGIRPSAADNSGRHAAQDQGQAPQRETAGNAAAGTAAAGTAAAGTAAAGTPSTGTTGTTADSRPAVDFGQTAADASARDSADTTARQSSDGDTVIRHDEQLNVDKQQEVTGKARLRKYVVTETQQVEVPVTREEVVVERTPISADEAARLGDESTIGDESIEVPLHEERLVVNKEQVPVERVRVGTEAVTETKTVSDDVRKERIDTDAGDSNRR